MVKGKAPSKRASRLSNKIRNLFHQTEILSTSIRDLAEEYDNFKDLSHKEIEYNMMNNWTYRLLDEITYLHQCTTSFVEQPIREILDKYVESTTAEQRAQERLRRTGVHNGWGNGDPESLIIK